MQRHTAVLSIYFLLFSFLLVGCAGKKTIVNESPYLTPSLATVQQIDSFKPEVICRQALEVVNNNPYEQYFFERVFARIVAQCENTKSAANAEIIWDNFVSPLCETGKVPPDLVKTTWNYYFAKQFVSLPHRGPVYNYCNQLAAIKKNIEKEYQLKKFGFNACEQGSPDSHFLNAMYVYNTMWATCHGTD